MISHQDPKGNEGNSHDTESLISKDFTDNGENSNAIKAVALKAEGITFLLYICISILLILYFDGITCLV